MIFRKYNRPLRTHLFLSGFINVWDRVTYGSVRDWIVISPCFCNVHSRLDCNFCTFLQYLFAIDCNFSYSCSRLDCHFPMLLQRTFAIDCNFHNPVRDWIVIKYLGKQQKQAQKRSIRDIL